ncbi:MAG: nucleoside phosphorylase [Promethearchaeota archaeon]|jgi:uridine phosphorylase
MPFPNFPNKYRETTLTNWKDIWEYRKSIGRYPQVDPPKGVIFTFQSKLMTYIIKNYAVKKVEIFFGDFYLLEQTQGNIGICGNFGIGAPSIAILLEQLAAFGVKWFISIGTAGALQKDLKLGNIVVCDRAIRDEGTSYHYIPAEKYSHPSERLNQKIKEAIEKMGLEFNVGTSWTTDAVFRETIKEIEHYKGEGVLTVDMEASAIFAVAHALNVDAGAMFTISDYLGDGEWKLYFHLTDDHLQILFKIAINTLNSL